MVTLALQTPRTSVRRRVGAGLLVTIAVVAGLSSCSKADQALRSLGPCPTMDEGPQVPAADPGTVYAWLPNSRPTNAPPTSSAPDPSDKGAPLSVPGWTDVVSIASTGYTTFAVKADGTVWAYGQGTRGLLGDGDLEQHEAFEPQQVPGLPEARSVHVVGSAAFVVTTEGAVWGWGDGMLASAGAVGVASDDLASPTRLEDLEDVVTFAQGGQTAMALHSDGSVSGWGINLTAVLGDQHGTELTGIDGLDGVIGIASSQNAELALMADGTVCAWGNNANGEFAVGPLGGQTGRPRAIRGLTDITEVAAGAATGYALDSDGTVLAWGEGESGALGDGNTARHISTTPTEVAGIPPAAHVYANDYSAFVVTLDGELWGWGSSLHVGDAAVPNNLPVQIPLPGSVLAVGGSHAIVDLG